MPKSAGISLENTNYSRGSAALAKTVKDLYAQGQTDYNMEPIILQDAAGNAVGRIKDGDAVVFCCRGLY
jgi:bisphosphoglycerate-independent phosphoglycerate mutase (AlkP superfamily)